MNDIPKIPDLKEVEMALLAAKSSFLDKDAYLLEVNANERSITHKYAEHLQAILSDWDVDCEYNRDGQVPKELHGVETEAVPKNDTDARTVFPDIIVHKRGNAGPNVLVIEAKKYGNDTGNDENKLTLYQAQLHYEYAALLVFHTGKGAGVDIHLK